MQNYTKEKGLKMKKLLKNYPITLTVFILGVIAIWTTVSISKMREPICFVSVDPCGMEYFVIDRVYDGDTFFVTFTHWHPVVGKNLGVRINGIDTPEIRTKSTKEKELAKEAKAFVIDMLSEAKQVKLLNVKRGKYFRLVADVVADNKYVADELIKEGLAIPYDGGTKTKDWSK